MLIILKKINFLITKRDKKRLIGLIFLLFVGMILEVFGLGILLPALTILSSPESIKEVQFLSTIKSYFPLLKSQDSQLIFLVSLVLIYLIKSVFLIFLTFIQYRFLSKLTAYVSNELYSTYLKQPYKFHVQRNASELIKNIQLEIHYFSTYIFSFVTVIIEGGFVFSVLVTLIYIEPFGAFAIGLFYGLLSFLFLKTTRKKISQWGSLRQNYDAEISKTALEGLGAIKDLLVLNRSNYFISKYSNLNYLKARINSNQGVLSQLPRYYFELVSVIGLISFIIFLIYTGKESKDIISILGVFVAATFRAIPSLNRIVGANQSLKFYKPSIDKIYSEIKLVDLSNEELNYGEMYEFKNSIVFSDVSYRYESRNLVLNDIDLVIKKGDIIGIIGESGSGKSTFVDLLIGLFKPTKGTVQIDGSPIYNNRKLKSMIGYISQSIYLIDDSITKNIALGIPENKIDNDRILDLIKKVKLNDFVESLEFGESTRVGERGVQISGGQRQRIGIARALYHNPQILILDEATSALDSTTEMEVIQAINELKEHMTVIMIAHRKSTLNIANRIYEIRDKKLFKI